MSADQEPRAEAIKVAIAAEMPAGVSVYEVDEVPGASGNSGDVPVRYVTIEITRRWHPERRGNADMVPGFALTTHYRAANISACRDLRRRTVAALENRAYVLPDGDTIGPFSFEFDGAPDYVAEGWSAFDTWRA